MLVCTECDRRAAQLGSVQQGGLLGPDASEQRLRAGKRFGRGQRAVDVEPCGRHGRSGAIYRPVRVAAQARAGRPETVRGRVLLTPGAAGLTSCAVGRRRPLRE
jgi:hypothetical protein